MMRLPGQPSCLQTIPEILLPTLLYLRQQQRHWWTYRRQPPKRLCRR